MKVEIQNCERGQYLLVVAGNRLLIRSRDKRVVEYYYAQAQAHYTSSSERYVCSIREPEQRIKPTGRSD